MSTERQFAYLDAALMAKARPLAALGSSSVAWTRDDATAVVAASMRTGVSILGGDAFHFANDAFTFAFEGWYCTRREGESFPEFVHRSGGEAVAYISSYKSPQNAEVFFEIVTAGQGPRSS